MFPHRLNVVIIVVVNCSSCCYRSGGAENCDIHYYVLCIIIAHDTLTAQCSGIPENIVLTFRRLAIERHRLRSPVHHAKRAREKFSIHFPLLLHNVIYAFV